MLCASPWLTLSYSSLVVVPAVSLKRQAGGVGWGGVGVSVEKDYHATFPVTLADTGRCAANKTASPRSLLVG